MKNIMKVSLLFTLLVLLSVSCKEDYEKYAYAREGMDTGGILPNVTFLAGKNFDYGDMGNTKLSFIADVAIEGDWSFNRMVIKKVLNGGDTIIHEELTHADMPMQIDITPGDAVDGFGITVGDIQGGDFIDWIFEIEFDDPEIKFNDNALDELFPDFRSYFVCAFDVASTVGTYQTTYSFWGHYDGTFEVVAGPGENQITIKDLLGHEAIDGNNYDLIVDVDPASGAAAIATQPAWDSDNYGWGYGMITADGAGYVLSCAGTISLNLTYCVPALGAGVCFTDGDVIFAAKQ